MQHSFDFSAGEIAKQQGMTAASEHAETIIPGWNQMAYDKLKEFCTFRLGPFLMEDFRQWAEPSGLPSPPHLRAYGSIAIKAARDGFIKKIGYAKVTNAKAHQATASVWIVNK